MEYRPAMLADVGRIAALHARSWQETYRGILPDQFLDHEVEDERLAVWQSRFAENRSNRLILVAEEGTQLAGFACVVMDNDPTYGALLDNLHVASLYQGRGVGQKLMRKTAQWVQQQAPDSAFYLWVYEINHAARAFYERMGGINQEAIKEEHGTALRYVWPDIQVLIQVGPGR